MGIEESDSIGGLTIKNRIVMAPMISNLANPDGSTNESHSAYLEERARGGVGLMITEYTYVNGRNSRGSLNELGFHNREFIPKLRRLTERIHSYGTRIFAQLVHAGGKALAGMNREEPVAPSAVNYTGYTPRELTVSEIGEIVEDFVRASRIAKDSRFDGIEIHGAHGYLVQEFLSPSLNRRTDSYGGPFENRMRFAVDIVEALKSEFDFPVGIRLSLYEDDPDGYGPEYGLKTAESIAGLDYAHFSAGRFAPPGSSASFYEDPFHIARKLPRKAAVKTMVVGSVRNRRDAEEVLKKADFVSVGRALLADPYFATKILENSGVLRPCIRCNQGCRDLSLGEVRCTVNPSTGLEASEQRFRILTGEVEIAGAGIKGMEAAITASRHGLKVTLYEKRDEIGGQLLDIRDEYKKKEFSGLLDYYRNALERYGVEVRTGESYSGRGIFCLPDRVYPELEARDLIKIDSNIYKHHDDALFLSRDHEVVMSRRSLTSLDRVRRSAFVKMAEQRGIKFSDDTGMAYDLSIRERMQYDIRAAMVSGRKTVENYVARNDGTLL